ncbi:hypothetical protein F511_35500 [Dorcoceras hygrometricum]|uniref:Uncharacterized protein n=1 Tax=Dorcoceras hygrometricum TaxID=472368 RepID=A0A2Z7B5P9_9LAMI|nr:hypothetical protein F511_35500 [Dorcoceras hygrometricum]
MRSVVASHGPGSNPRGARHRIPARKLHGLPGTGPNQTLEEFRPAVTTSPERRPAGGRRHEKSRRHKGARAAATRAALHARACAIVGALWSASNQPVSPRFQSSSGHRAPRAARRRSIGQPTSSLHRRKRAASCAPPPNLRATSVAPSAGQRVANGRSIVREVSIGFGAIAHVVRVEEWHRRLAVARSSRAARMRSIARGGAPPCAAAPRHFLQNSFDLDLKFNVSYNYGNSVSMTFRVVRTNQYNQDLGLIHSTNGNHLESPNEGSSIDHQVTIYLHAQNITMFPTNETCFGNCVDLSDLIGDRSYDEAVVTTSSRPPLLSSPLQPPPHTRAAAVRLLRGRTCSNHTVEEISFVSNSSALIVQTDKGILILVVDRIKEIYRRLP